MIGNRLNVELADYMAKFLAFELESSWERTKKKNGLSGIAQKNDYIQGVAEGLIFKLKKQKDQESPASKEALMAMEKSLDDRVKLVYPRLGTTTRRTADPDSKANRLGNEDGRNLSIRQGVTSPEAPLSLPES